MRERCRPVNVSTVFVVGSCCARGSLELPDACGTQSVEYDEDFGGLVDQDDGCESQNSGDRQWKKNDDDRQGQDDVLIDDATTAAGVVYGARDQSQVIAGERDIR